MMQEYIGNTGAFAGKLSAMLRDLKIEEGCKNLEIDHICLRLKDPNHVTQIREEFGSVGKEISCESVNGRDIMIFQLDEPLEVMDWRIYGIELPFPKPHHKYEDGWEHVEFVLSEADSTMDSLKQAFFGRFNLLIPQPFRVGTPATIGTWKQNTSENHITRVYSSIISFAPLSTDERYSPRK